MTTIELFEKMVPIITGILVFLFGRMYENYRKRGKVILEQTFVQIRYSIVQYSNYINSIDLELNFINSSGFDKIIRIVKFRFYDGTQFYELQCPNSNLSPTFVIEAKKKSEQKYDLRLPSEKVLMPMLGYIKQTLSLEIWYKVDKKVYTKIIDGSEFHLVENWTIV